MRAQQPLAISSKQLAQGGWIQLHDPWLEQHEATQLFITLQNEVPWKQEKIRFLGKQLFQPRLTAWYGDSQAVYTYSGLTLTPLSWSKPLACLKQRVEQACGSAFNSVLLNYYRTGNDSMGFHADAEKELGINPLIASVSLGDYRRFILKYVGKGKEGVPVEFWLGHGSLLVMGGTTQHHYRHGVPKQQNVGPRINLTFRLIR